MRDSRLTYAVIWILALMLSGCVIRTYPLTKDRVDQELSAGNRGYLKGRLPEKEAQEKERKTTRTTQAVEIELYPPVKFEKMPKPKVSGPTEDRELWGNRGYVTRSYSPEIAEPSEPMAAKAENMEKYKVQKGDTLQKISLKFYGTTKNWNRIYQANRDKLKGPNKIYPGQTIDVPLEGLRKGTGGNLK